LGFSGSGRGEPELAKLVSDISGPACLVLDYEANCPSPEHMEKTLPEFIRIYRDVHPDVPILVLSKIRYARELFDDALLEKRLRMQRFQRETVERLNRQGDRNIYFYDGSGLLGANFHECTVDGVHPTDLGFMRMADGLTPVLQKLLQ
jgi:lysophospholipase L1-like esterase